MPQALRTANPADSIWKNLPEDTFRKHIVQLMQKTDQPIKPRQTFEAFCGRKIVANAQKKPQEERTLSIELELGLANDFAFLAAIEEGARSVAACCVEEKVTHEERCLIVRLAGNNDVPRDIKDGIRGICQLLRSQLSGGNNFLAI